MNHYEIVLMVHPDQSDQVAVIVGNYVEKIRGNGGTIHRQEDWGRKSLAYPIRNLHKAHFTLLNVEMQPERIKDLKEALRYNNFILRSLILKTTQAETEPSVMVQARKQHEAA